MERSVASELEFDKVLQLVAAHARTGVGRAVVERLTDHAGEREEYSRNARFTIAVQDLLEDEDAFALTGIDDALPWLEEDSLPPSEPRDLLSLLTLARRVAAVARRLESSENELLMEFARRLPDTADLVAEVAPLLGRDGSVSDSASPELARLRREITRTRSAVVVVLECVRLENREIVTDAPPTMRSDRYCLPLRSSARSQMEGLLLDVSAR